MQNVPSIKVDIKVHWKINKNPLEKNQAVRKYQKNFKSFSKEKERSLKSLRKL